MLSADNACLTLAAPCNLGDAATAAAVIGDGDTGYGNAVNVKRTVAGYAAAGFAGILLEDQQVCWGAGCCCLGAAGVLPAALPRRWVVLIFPQCH